MYANQLSTNCARYCMTEEGNKIESCTSHTNFFKTVAYFDGCGMSAAYTDISHQVAVTSQLMKVENS